jgi:hypothetical protein
MSLEKLGITLSEDDLKQVKTNKELAIIGIENIIRYMRNKCTDQSAYNLDKQSKSWLIHYSDMLSSELNRLKK